MPRLRTLPVLTDLSRASQSVASPLSLATTAKKFGDESQSDLRQFNRLQHLRDIAKSVNLMGRTCTRSVHSLLVEDNLMGSNGQIVEADGTSIAAKASSKIRQNKEQRLVDKFHTAMCCLGNVPSTWLRPVAMSYIY